MAIVFFIEIYQTQPNFSSKIDQDGVISIYSSLNKEVAEQNNGKHKDIGYSAKINACVEFDCSGFVVGQNAAGKIDLCADCPAPQQPTPPSPAGNCAAYSALNSYLNNVPAQVLNSDSDTATAYETHLQNATNAAGARSGYWLGLTDCDSVATPYQCGVSCGTSGVALCYPTSGGLGLQGFGDVKTLNGKNYQIYDPVQLHAAGVSPSTGMSFTLSAAAPNWSAASAGTQCNGPTGINMSGAENCLSNNPSPPTNFNSVGGGTGLPQSSGYVAASGSSLFSGVLVSGVGSSGTSIGIGDQCFYVGGGSSFTEAATGSGGLIFGGSGTPVVSLESLGGSSYNSCQECVEDNVSVPCQSLASSQISINGAPEYSSSSGWGPASTGSVVWENWNNGDPNTEGYSEGFKEMTCAMDDKDGQTHGPLGDGARAIMPGISCTNDGGDKRCKPNHLPSSMLIDGVVTPPNKCCQSVNVGDIYQGFGFDCEQCCEADIGVSVFYGPVFKGFGCPCEDEGGSCSDVLCPPGACTSNLDCKKPGQDGYTPPNSDPTGPISETGEKTEKSEDEKQLCVRYGNNVQKTSVVAVSANVGPLSFAEITYEKQCGGDYGSCSETFIAFFTVSSDGLVDVGGEIVGPDENDEPSTYPDGSPIEPVSVGNLKGALERLGGEDISIFINVSSCHMANSGANPWTLYGTGDVIVGGEIANPSTPDGTGGVKSAYDDPNSPYGNDDDGVECG
jgi:hypothetical protein